MSLLELLDASRHEGAAVLGTVNLYIVIDP